MAIGDEAIALRILGMPISWTTTEPTEVVTATGSFRDFVPYDSEDSVYAVLEKILDTLMVSTNPRPRLFRTYTGGLRTKTFSRCCLRILDMPWVTDGIEDLELLGAICFCTG